MDLKLAVSEGTNKIGTAALSVSEGTNRLPQQSTPRK